MEYTIRKTVLKYVSDKEFWQRDAEKIRGYFGNLYKEEDLFHNHSGECEFIYRLPLIQYKVIEGQLTIVGINEGSELVAKEFLKHKTIPLGNAVFTNFETQLEIKTEELRVTEELFSYRFETPWLPINQKNLKAYKNGELDLDRVLSNNILTIFKGCKIEADKKIMVKGEYEEKSIKMKDIHMIGFGGSFVTNVKIPEYLGLGSRGANGFGCVVNK